MMNSKARIIPIFFILILSVFPIIPFTESAGYGEENENLGQFTDDFENDDNVSVAVNVINNQTLDCMELNYTEMGGGIVYENYSTYTENDANNRFTVSNNIIVVESLGANDKHHYVTYDYGVAYFKDFTHDLEARARDNSGTAGNDRMYIWLLANVTDDPYDMYANNDEFIGLSFYGFDTSHPGNPRIYFRKCVNGVYTLVFYEPATLNTWYYFRIVKSGTSLVCGIYSNSILRNAGDGTDGDIGNLVLTLDSDWNFRYIYGVSDDWNGEANRLISGDIHNLTIGKGDEGGYETDGYFTTEDYLNYTTGQGLTLLTNSSIPYGTSMTVQFSNDNVTWVDNEGNVGSTPVLDGFYAIDLRDLNYTDSFKMYNLTTMDSMITPRLFQSRLVTTNGTAGAGPPGPGPTVIIESFFWIPIAIVLSIITALLVWMKFGNQ